MLTIHYNIWYDAPYISKSKSFHYITLIWWHMSDLCCSINIWTCWFCCSLAEKIFHNKVNICFGFTFAHLSTILIYLLFMFLPWKVGTRDFEDFSNVWQFRQFYLVLHQKIFNVWKIFSLLTWSRQARCEGPGVLAAHCCCISSDTTQWPAADIKAVLRYSSHHPAWVIWAFRIMITISIPG